MFFPEARVAEREGECFGIATADEGFELSEFALCGLAGGVLDVGEEFAHVGGGAHHLVDGGEVGPAAEAENLGHLLANFEQLEKNWGVHRIAAVVVGEVHAPTQRGAGGVGHHRSENRWVGGEGDRGVGGELAGLFPHSETLEEVWRKAAEFVGIGDFDLADVVLHGARETHAELGGLVGELANLLAGSVVAVDAGEAVAEERALEIVLCGGVFVARVERFEGLVDVAIQTQLDAFSGDDLRERLGGVADGREWMHHEHDVRLAAGHAQMPGGLVIEREGLGGRAHGVGGEEIGDAVARGLQVGLDPGLRLFCGVEAGPEVQHVCGGGCCGGRLRWRLDHWSSSLLRLFSPIRD